MNQGPVSQFIEHHYRHFNAAALMDAAKGYVTHIDEGGKMMVTLAGAMSTAELGISFAEMIRQGKVAIISCTGANLEEDIMNLVAHSHYKRVPNYRDLSPQEEWDLLKNHYNRVTDTCIPEEEAFRRLPVRPSPSSPRHREQRRAGTGRWMQSSPPTNAHETRCGPWWRTPSPRWPPPSSWLRLPRQRERPSTRPPSSRRTERSICWAPRPAPTPPPTSWLRWLKTSWMLLDAWRPAPPALGSTLRWPSFSTRRPTTHCLHCPL